MSLLEIKVKYFNPNMPKLVKIDKGDWIDLRIDNIEENGNLKPWLTDLDNVEFCYINPNSFIKIKLGIAMQLPKGYESHVAPRGSTFKNFKMIQTNSVGVVDESYCGDNDEWFVPMYCFEGVKITRYERICQFRIMEKMPKLIIEEVLELNNKDRGGFGSTGVK
jgi:dUTP pyrophosphatase